MELDDLILLGACALLSGVTGGGGFSNPYEKPDDSEIGAAVHDAHRVWQAVLAEKGGNCCAA